jgi:hypothetical protein
MDTLVQFAVLQPNELDLVQNMFLKWSYVLHVVKQRC